MCPCVRLSYRSVNYQHRERERIWRQPDRPYQLVSGRLFHFPRGGVDVTEAQSVAQVGGEHVREGLGAGSRLLKEVHEVKIVDQAGGEESGSLAQTLCW
jgi:hypothetical protein